MKDTPESSPKLGDCIYNPLVARELKLSNSPLWAWKWKRGGESGAVAFEMCCVLFDEISSLAYCFNALTLCGLLWLNAVNLYLSSCCFRSPHTSATAISAQFILGFPTLLCSCVQFQICCVWMLPYIGWRLGLKWFYKLLLFLIVCILLGNWL